MPRPKLESFGVGINPLAKNRKKRLIEQDQMDYLKKIDATFLYISPSHQCEGSSRQAEGGF